MPRRLLCADEAALAALELTEMVGKKRPTKQRAPSKSKARKDIREMLTSGQFQNVRASHLVALYEWCHEQVYGVAPAELEQGKTWQHAVFAAARLMREEFDGNGEAAVEFIRWTWQREQAREMAIRSNGLERVGRIGWRVQFVQRHVVTDYRLYLARRRSVACSPTCRKSLPTS